MLVVARDGIEPPTPAFSGLDSAIAITNTLNDLHHSDRLESTLFWDSNGTEEWDNNPGRSNLPSPCLSHAASTDEHQAVRLQITKSLELTDEEEGQISAWRFRERRSEMASRPVRQPRWHVQAAHAIRSGFQRGIDNRRQP